MQSIEIDFDVWKALTHRRESEGHSYNDVLRVLLGLPAIVGEESPAKQASGGRGRYLGGRWLPDGTVLRARYKGHMHEAEIRDGQLLDSKGNAHASASAAAKAVTATSVNGLTFWSVKRPSDSEWLSLFFIAKTK